MLYTNATWPYNNTLYNSTNLTLIVYANDTSGNVGNYSTSWILDNSKPNIQYVVPALTGGFYNDNFSMEVFLANTKLNYSMYNITNESDDMMQENSTDLSTSTFTWRDSMNVTALEDGNYTMNVMARDHVGNNYTKSTWFYVDQSVPSVSAWLNPTLANDTHINNGFMTFNISCTDTFVDTVWIEVDGVVNASPYNSGDYYYWTLNLSEGTHNYTAYCNDSANNMNNTETRIVHVDLSTPYWSDNKTLPVSSSTYSPGQEYQFNITWNDNYNVSHVWFEHNFTGTLQNYTYDGMNADEYYLDHTDLAAGTYTWRSFANDTAKNMNYTETWTYVVERAGAAINLTLDENNSNTTI
jgi:hypothetical protein